MQWKSDYSIYDELKILEKTIKTETNQKTSIFMCEFLKSKTEFYQSLIVSDGWKNILCPQISSIDD
jgi:hypothetical protein